MEKLGWTGWGGRGIYSSESSRRDPRGLAISRLVVSASRTTTDFPVEEIKAAGPRWTWRREVISASTTASTTASNTAAAAGFTAAKTGLNRSEQITKKTKQDLDLDLVRSGQATGIGARVRVG
jgi:hypothetical protein